MKYACSIVIDCPRDKVIALFEDAERMGEWQSGFISFKHLSGTRGTPGSKAKIVYQIGKRPLEMVETLERYDLPNEMVAIYEAGKVWNRNVNRFTDLGDKTAWDIDCEFKCGGFIRVLAFFMPSMFRKQTEKMMHDFKAWAESQA